MTVHWKHVLVGLSAAAILSGCSQFGDMPDVTKLPERVLSTGEQQAKVAAMAERGQQHQTEVAKEIEGGVTSGR